MLIHLSSTLLSLSWLVCRLDITSATLSSCPAARSPSFGLGKFVTDEPGFQSLIPSCSVQTVTGGQCMEVLLTAIWPSFAKIPNTVPKDQGLTTAGFIAFFLYFLLQLPFLCIPYTKIQYFFGFKSIIAPIIFLAVFGSTLHKAGGTISHSTVITESTTVHGSVLAWAFFSNLNSVLGNYATLGLNIADFSRYANKPSAQNIQAFVIPFIFTIVGLLGIFTAAAAEPAYGHVIWNPIEIINYWQAGGSHGGRAAAAFGAIGLLIVTLGINISANSISAANDLVAFCPKYINIRRGQLLAAVIGAWACVPVYYLCASYVCILLTVVVVENPCIGSKVPRFPRRLHHLPRTYDRDPDDRVSTFSTVRCCIILTLAQLLHHPSRQRLSA
jgi:NCS1 nucleoside transporter family